jgi:hypothetical protein
VHTNPVLIAFCSLLYYKNLRDHVHNYRIERKCIENGINMNDEFRIKIVEFTGKPIAIQQDTKHKAYKKFIVNRWCVILMLHYNKSLIKYRKHHLKKIEQIEKSSFLQKICSCYSNMCVCCHKIKLK